MTLTPASPSRRSRQPSWLSGFSLAEMVVTITTIGVMAGIVISQYGGTTEVAKSQLAKDKIKMLNDAFHKHQMSNTRDNLETQSRMVSSSFDELNVLRHLKYRRPVDPAPGSPYLDPTYVPSTSSSKRDYRMQWTGGGFKLIPPGQAGVGIKVVFDGSDHGTPIPYPPGYKWGGR